MLKSTVLRHIRWRKTYYIIPGIVLRTQRRNTGVFDKSAYHTMDAGVPKTRVDIQQARRHDQRSL